ncbi:hypothetical protein ACSBR1_032657 [Camellia fascicularis]
MEFFKHFERVLYDKRYKELEAEYNLCQKLPRVSIPTVICKKFEVKGIVCRHCLKVLREIINAKDLPAQYILKRWTKKARAESVKDRRGHDVKADVKLHQSDRYRSLMNMFRVIASRGAESEETYHLSLVKGKELSVMVEDKLSVHTCGQVEITEFRNSSANTCPQSDEVDCPIQAKGLKKRQATSKGRRRIKGGMEKSIAKKKRMQSKQVINFVMCVCYVFSILCYVCLENNELNNLVVCRVMVFVLLKVNMSLLLPWVIFLVR